MGLFSAILGNAGNINPVQATKEYERLLLNTESIQLAFKLVRDVFLLTDKRLIVINVQGLTGSKVEYLSIAYKSISRFSVESAGTFDLDADLKIWLSGESNPCLQRKFSKSVNVFEVQKVLAQYITQ